MERRTVITNLPWHLNPNRAVVKSVNNTWKEREETSLEAALIPLEVTLFCHLFFNLELNMRTPKQIKLRQREQGGKRAGKRGRGVSGAPRSSFPLCLHKSILSLSNCTQKKSQEP